MKKELSIALDTHKKEMRDTQTEVIQKALHLLRSLDISTAADSTRNEPVRFGGVTFLSGMYVWCDGVVVVDREWCV